MRFQQCGMCDQQSLRSACEYAQSNQRRCYPLEYSMNIKLLTKQRLEFLSLKGGYTCSYESTLIKMPHCWKSHVVAPLYIVLWHALTCLRMIPMFVTPDLGPKSCKKYQQMALVGKRFLCMTRLGGKFHPGSYQWN